MQKNKIYKYKGADNGIDSRCKCIEISNHRFELSDVFKA